MSEPTVTYAHENAPNGQRFMQYKKDKLPIWAVDVQEENT